MPPDKPGGLSYMGPCILTITHVPTIPNFTSVLTNIALPVTLSAMIRPLAALVLCAVILAPPAGADISPSPAPTDTLQVTASEREFFQLGSQLGQAAFAYAGLARQAAEIAHTHSKLTQVQRLAALAPEADRSRTDARAGFLQAVALMQVLQAPPAALEPVQAAAERLSRPIALHGDAQTIAHFSKNAAQTLGALDEFNELSSLPEDADMQAWLTSPLTGASGHVWYAEGLIAALSDIAAARQMPELLPPVQEIATDLRGLRDWLALRLPDTPTPDQAALEVSINDFLNQTTRTGVSQTTTLTPAQLQAVGEISHRLQAQIDHSSPPMSGE
jgi:hypothetical protein